MELSWSRGSASPGSQGDLSHYLDYYDCDRVHTGLLSRGRIPAEVVYVPAR
jgi:hypothetical protein